MDTGLIITIIIFVVVSIVILKIVTKLIKAVLMILIIAFLITSIFGFFTYQDSVELKNNLENELNLVLLQDNEKIVAGFVATDFEEEAEFLTISQVAEYQNSFKKQDYKKMLGDNYKMFIIEIKAFDLVDEELYFNGKKTSKSFLYTLLKSNDPISLYKSETGIDPALNGNSDPMEFKANIFAVLFSEAIDKRGTFFIFGEYKKKNIIVYPETIVFKFMGLIPTSFVKNMFENAKNSTINKINQTIKG